MLDQPDRRASLHSGDLAAEISPLGAQLWSLRDRAGRDLLWGGDPAIWAGRAPLLFPIVGALAGGCYRLGGKIYKLPRHGFARGRVFELLDSTSATATFGLKADEISLEVYPFRFELQLRFALDGPALSIAACVKNAGNEAMPASFGYHPAFRWPLPYGRARSAHFIEFAGEETAPIRRLNADGLLTSERYPTPVSHRRLLLADTLFQQDAIIFDEIGSRSLSYGAEDGVRIRVSYGNTPYLGVWTKPGADFICIEPWHGIADPEGFCGDFSAKPGVFVLAPGAAMTLNMTITVLGE